MADKGGFFSNLMNKAIGAFERTSPEARRLAGKIETVNQELDTVDFKKLSNEEKVATMKEFLYGLDGLPGPEKFNILKERGLEEAYIKAYNEVEDAKRPSNRQTVEEVFPQANGAPNPEEQQKSREEQLNKLEKTLDQYSAAAEFGNSFAPEGQKKSREELLKDLEKKLENPTPKPQITKEEILNGDKNFTADPGLAKLDPAAAAQLSETLAQKNAQGANPSTPPTMGSTTNSPIGNAFNQGSAGAQKMTMADIGKDSSFSVDPQAMAELMQKNPAAAAQLQAAIAGQSPKGANPSTPPTMGSATNSPINKPTEATREATAPNQKNSDMANFFGGARTFEQSNDAQSITAAQMSQMKGSFSVDPTALEALKQSDPAAAAQFEAAMKEKNAKSNNDSGVAPATNNPTEAVRETTTTKEVNISLTPEGAKALLDQLNSLPAGKASNVKLGIDDNGNDVTVPLSAEQIDQLKAQMQSAVNSPKGAEASHAAPTAPAPESPKVDPRLEAIRNSLAGQQNGHDKSNDSEAIATAALAKIATALQGNERALEKGVTFDLNIGGHEVGKFTLTPEQTKMLAEMNSEKGLEGKLDDIKNNLTKALDDFKANPPSQPQPPSRGGGISGGM